MRAITTILLLAVMLVAATHAYFYWAFGEIEPCRVAVRHVVQKQRQQGNEAVAALGQAFEQQAVEVMRNEGLGACYRSAFTGEAPQQLTLRFNLRR